jgi:hypothetical protein
MGITASSLAVPQQPYVLKVHTDEVALSFHAVDEKDRAITDLAVTDLEHFHNMYIARVFPAVFV